MMPDGPVKKEQPIQKVLEAFNLGQNEMAHALHVAPFTVSRWVTGRSQPTGLSKAIISGLHLVAMKLKEEPAKREVIRGRIMLGIGSVIYYGLREARR